MAPRRWLDFALVVLVATAASSCFDPVHSKDVDALGPEQSGVPEGPTHRPGQPCRTCHGGDGPGEPEFVVAGTVYLARNDPEPAVGTVVVIRDSSNTKELRRVTTNEVGNFYVTVDELDTFFPLFVSLEDPRADNKLPKEMNTPIGRNGGCAFCHYGADGEPTHMPPVFLKDAR